ncbi:CrcB family protein [Caldimonas sp. KR1-144]|uniref:CrcB family protein n=1 Tax=Caldimonas sp. KR1-144 TaxID=3400911 RepID=UPI003C0C1F24
MTPTLGQALVVAGGAATGGVLRWLLGLWLNPLWGGFALGTLAVNAAGGLLVGSIGAWLFVQPSEWLRLLLVTGLLGGFTTFSAFSIESLMLLQRGAFGLALLHTAGHLLGSLACAALGWWLVHALLAPR